MACYCENCQEKRAAWRRAVIEEREARDAHLSEVGATAAREHAARIEELTARLRDTEAAAAEKLQAQAAAEFVRAERAHEWAKLVLGNREREALAEGEFFQDMAVPTGGVTGAARQGSDAELLRRAVEALEAIARALTYIPIEQRG
jgi:hypothetical protein